MEHDPGIVRTASAVIVANWPKGTFAESVAVDATGALFVSLHTDCAVVKIDPATGAVKPFASFDRPVTGLVFLRDGTLFATGGAPGEAPGVVWRVSADGGVAVVAEITEARFLNGATPLGRHILVADSLGAVIYRIDPESGGVERWLADPLLAAPSQGAGPGANGIKVFGGTVTISVTGADRMLHLPVADGAAGRVTILAENLRADDFAFGESGALYIATHPAASLLRLDPDGSRTTLAEAAQGMVGATAVAFGRSVADRHAVYVTTTGGTWILPPDEVEPAKLVRVEVGEAGYPLTDRS